MVFTGRQGWAGDRRVFGSNKKILEPLCVFTLIKRNLIVRHLATKNHAVAFSIGPKNREQESIVDRLPEIEIPGLSPVVIGFRKQPDGERILECLLYLPRDDLFEVEMAI